MSRRLDPLIVGVLAAAVSLAGAARPSFWYDEAATISASYSRSLAQLWQMLGNVDAVHGLYYLFMHGWFQIFPPTEFWSRAPSGLAVGGAAAGVVVLGKQFSSRTVALSAGVLCGILPRTTWAGIEARPYAMSMMAAVWLTVLLVVAARRESRWSGCLTGSSWHCRSCSTCIWRWCCWRTSSSCAPSGATRRCWFRSPLRQVVTVCALAPFVFEVVGQVQQIKWIAPIGHRTIEDVVVQQYFERSPPFAVLSALVVAAAIALWRWTSAKLDRTDRQLLTLAVAWLVIPTALIVLGRRAVHPIYTPRYLSFTAPAMALILGVCIGALAAKPWVSHGDGRPFRCRGSAELYSGTT